MRKVEQHIPDKVYFKKDTSFPGSVQYCIPALQDDIRNDQDKTIEMQVHLLLPFTMKFI